jgi:hypothetical protein
MLHDLLAEIASQGDYRSTDGPEPVVSLEMFFDGNDDMGSIACNLTEHPGLDRFSAILRDIRDRPDVFAVWVGISEVMDDTQWPFSDHVYVVTTATAPEVATGPANSSRTSRPPGGGPDSPRSPDPHPGWRHPGDPVVGLTAAIWRRSHRKALSGFQPHDSGPSSRVRTALASTPTR